MFLIIKFEIGQKKMAHNDCLYRSLNPVFSFSVVNIAVCNLMSVMVFLSDFFPSLSLLQPCYFSLLLAKSVSLFHFHGTCVLL